MRWLTRRNESSGLTTLLSWNGKPLVSERHKGIRLVGTHLEIVDGRCSSRRPAHSRRKRPQPVDLHDDGLDVLSANARTNRRLRAVEGVLTYDDQINDQVHTATKNQGEGDLDSLFTAGDTHLSDHFTGDHFTGDQFIATLKTNR